MKTERIRNVAIVKLYKKIGCARWGTLNSPSPSRKNREDSSVEKFVYEKGQEEPVVGYMHCIMIAKTANDLFYLWNVLSSTWEAELTVSKVVIETVNDV